MATTKQQSKVLNIVMIALAAVIVVAGIAVFMLIRGGGQGQSTSFTISEKTGYANIERSGINYSLDVGTALQDGDVVETLNGSEVGVKGPGDSKLFLADASKMQVHAPDSTPAQTTIDLVSGCMFTDAQCPDDAFSLAGSGLSWKSNDAVFVSDVRKGTVTVQVLSGNVTLSDGSTLQMGETNTYFIDREDASAGASSAASGASASGASASKMPESSKGKLTLGSMDAFALEHALDAASSGRKLVFTEDEIKGEQDRREAERRQLAEQASAASQASNASESASSASAQDPEKSEAGQGATGEEGLEAGAEDADVDEGQSDVPAEDEDLIDYVEGGGAEEAHSCVIQIRCDTILDNMDNLAEGKNKYVPKNGILLNSTSMEFTEGETAFDVLQRVCSEAGIALEYSYAPIYGSYYVEGIGNLYEFDCGDESGWMYKVNGWFPNYGCSQYQLEDGDIIEFCYTCYGLGEDVGA